MSNVPKLRFNEYSDSYRRYAFDELFTFSSGKNIKQAEASPEFETLCVRYGELYHMYGEVIRKVVNCTNLSRSELVFSQGNEILLPSAGEDPLDISSASALTVANVAIGRTINVLRPLRENVYSHLYMSYYINQKLRRKISVLAKGVSISNVYNTDLKTLEAQIPKLAEQQKIADSLTAVDTKIEQLTKKKELLTQYKKGVTQKIFSQEIRFKADDGSDFPGWEEKTLGDLCKVARSGGTPAATNREYYHGGIPFLSISDMTTQGKYLRYTTKTLSQKGMDNSAAWLVPENTVIYSMYASVGFVSINKIPLATSQAVINLIFKENVDAEFIYYYLSDFGRHIHRFIETGTQGNLNAQIVKGFAIRVPSLVEQTKIANFLSSIDSKIDQVQKQLASVKSFKNGLLQQMFV